METATTIGNDTSLVYVSPYEPSIAIWSGIVLLVFMIVGIVLNSLTILVIKSTSKLRNVFMQLILSLCVSDLLSALVSPLLWYRRTIGFEQWLLPEFLCKIYWAVDLMTSYATSLHIMLFAVLRLVSIKYPVKFDHMSNRKANLWILIIWIISCCVGFIPSFFFFNSKLKDRLGNSPDSRWPGCTINVERYKSYRIYQIVVFPVVFCVPIFVIIVTSVLIVVAVRSHSKASLKSGVITKQQAAGREKKEKQAVLQLVLIVISFFIGYMPFTIYQFWITSGVPNTVKHHRMDYWFGLIEYLLLRFSECLNPVFYNVGSGNMRKYTKKFLKNNFRTFKSTMFGDSERKSSKGHSVTDNRRSLSNLGNYTGSSKSNEFGV